MVHASMPKEEQEKKDVVDLIIGLRALGYSK
jgi:hypothetical protein